MSTPRRAVPIHRVPMRCRDGDIPDLAGNLGVNDRNMSACRDDAAQSRTRKMGLKQWATTEKQQ